MIRLRNVSFAMMGILSALASTGLADNLIFNGSFEEGDYDNPGFVRVLPGETRIAAWQVGGMGVDWHLATENPNANPNFTGAHFGPAQDGSLVMDLNLDGWGSGTIQQSFPTMPDHVYHVSFHMAASNWFTNPRAVLVEVFDYSGNTLASHTFHTLGSDQFDMQWQRFEFAFLSSASYGMTTLRFSSPDDSGFWGPLLDDVHVQASDTSRPYVESKSATTSPQGLHEMRLTFSERLQWERGSEWPSTYVIVSAGPDRRIGTADDLEYPVERVRRENAFGDFVTLIVTPASVVPLNYPVRVTVLRSRIHDLYGNSMAEDYIWNFTNGPRPPRR